jgi:hypothetical protein
LVQIIKIDEEISFVSNTTQIKLRMDMNCEPNVWGYELLDLVKSEKINWCHLSMNPNAIHLLEQNPEKIVWRFLSLNPNAIHLLEQNFEKIDWWYLSGNPNAIHLIVLKCH